MFLIILLTKQNQLLFMKQIKTLFLFCALSILIFSGCKKSEIQKLSSSNSDEISLSQNNSVFTLSLKPGKNGQDVYVAKETGVESDNVNYVPELSIASWTIDGNLYTAGTYIRFNALAKVPQTAKVLSAELHLYSLTSSLSTPQGNFGDNACNIKRVIEPWDESEINYTNRPATSDLDKATLPASTSQWNYNPVVDVTKLASYMVAHPDQNFGFYIKLKTQEPYRSLVFGSSEQSDPSLRPKLVIRYTE